MENQCVHDQHRLKLTYPASWWKNMWREGLPSGNGQIATSVYGGVKDETIVLTHGSLWHGGKKADVPDLSHTLAETRKLMDEKKYLDASWHLTHSLKETGYQSRLAARLPVGALTLSMPSTAAFKKYERELNMKTGEVFVRFDDAETSYERKLFVSRKDDVIVYEVTAENGSIHGELSIGLQQSSGGKLQDRYPYLVENLDRRADESYFYYATKNEDDTDFGAVLRIIHEDGEITNQDNKLLIQQSKKVTILVKLFIKSEREIEWKKLHDELAKMNQSYAQLLKRHTELHTPLIQSAQMSLNGEKLAHSNEELLLQAYGGEAPTNLIEKMWAYGRYLFISGTNQDAEPFGLYGLWYGDYRLMWSHNMANENIQMMYWHAAVGGLIELVPALFNYYESMMDIFRKNAQNLYGCRGIFIPAGTTPGIGVPNQIVPVIMNWTGAAGWLAKHYYDYYIYTNDQQFLKEKLLPFMKEAALFYEDFLVLGEDGKYKIYPSVSPENTPVNFMPEDGKPLNHPMPTTINATADVAIIKELFTNVIEGSLLVQENAEKIPVWQEILEKLPSYELNEDGAIREWIYPEFDDRYDHRHLSHIYPVFPGQEFTKEEHPERFKAFERAVELRLIGAQTGWSLVHMAAIYARFENGEKALECLDILSRSCLLNNFFTLHNDWRDMGICMNSATAPVQMDANIGFVHAVQEMLLYVSPKMIKILPALPKKWQYGEVKDFRIPTGNISFTWDTRIKQLTATVIAERDTKLVIKLPSFVEKYEITGNNRASTRSDLGANYIEVVIMEGNECVVQTSS